MDEPRPFRWMTYRHLSEVWGCSLDAARERVRRNKWSKQPGNSREILVAVPPSELEEATSPDLAGGAARSPNTNQAANSPSHAGAAPENSALPELGAAELWNRLRTAEQQLARAEGERTGLRTVLRMAETALNRVCQREKALFERASRAEQHAADALAVMRQLTLRVEQIQQAHAAEQSRLTVAEEAAESVKRIATDAIAAAEARAEDACQRAAEEMKRREEAEREAAAAIARLDSFQQNRLQRLQATSSDASAVTYITKRPWWHRLFRL
jgi:hypothetical protein